jgi:hypothetical protein
MLMQKTSCGRTVVEEEVNGASVRVAMKGRANRPMSVRLHFFRIILV